MAERNSDWRVGNRYSSTTKLGLLMLFLFTLSLRWDISKCLLCELLLITPHFWNVAVLYSLMIKQIILNVISVWQKMANSSVS